MFKRKTAISIIEGYNDTLIEFMNNLPIYH